MTDTEGPSDAGGEWPVRGLTLHGFRSFERYELPNLTRVTLLVGSNNSGKTSVLEAIELLATRGMPRELAQAAMRRSRGIGRPVMPGDHSWQDSHTVGHDVSQWFFGHEISAGSSFSIEVDGSVPSLHVAVHESSTVPETARRRRPSFSGEDMDDLFLVYGTGSESSDRLAIPITRDGLLLSRLSRLRAFSNRIPDSGSVVGPVAYMDTDGVRPEALQETWGRVVRAGREHEVVDVLRVVEPRLSSIHFVPSTGRGRFSLDEILLGFSGSGIRIPLGSHGEGTRRLLGLALSLIEAEGGFLLIDEIDTGLHWQVLPAVWRIVVTGARKFGTQVLATSHSLDCLHGFEGAVRGDPELADVSVQRIDRGHARAVEMPGRLLQTIVRRGVEVR